nr:hypothetical protein [Tanacetum cinerariifolium]
MAISSSSSSSDNEVQSCSTACSKSSEQLHSQYDTRTVEFRKSRLDVLSYQAVLESVEARLVVMQPSGGYNVVPPPITRNFMPPKPDLAPVVSTAKGKNGKWVWRPKCPTLDHDFRTTESDSESLSPSSLYNKSQPSDGYHALIPSKPAQDLSHTNRPSAPIIKESVSDSEDESETNDLQFIPSFVQSSKQVKTPRHSVQPAETSIPIATPKPSSPKFYRSGKRKNRKTYFVCKSVDHLIKDCNYHAMKKAQPTPRNYVHRGTHKQNALFTHNHPQMHMVPATVLTQSKPVSITDVRPICVVVPKIMVTRLRHAHSIDTKFKSPIRRHITYSPSPKTSNLPPKVTAVKAPVVSAAQAEVNVASVYGYYCLKSMFIEKLKLIINAD